jgi:hypothetical protein
VSGRILAFLPGLVGIAVVAGCGGSNASSVASLPSTTGTASTSQAGAASSRPSSAALITCLRAHGLQAALASAGGNGGVVTLGDVAIIGANPASPQFQSALNACRKYMPGGGPPTLTPAQQAQAAKAMERFARCMRTHGVPDFPDPSPTGFFTPGSIQKIGPGSPLVTRAFPSCESLEPKAGPRLELGSNRAGVRTRS